MSRNAGSSLRSPGIRILVAAAVLLASSSGCLWGRGARVPPSPLPGDTEEFVTRIEEPEPASESADPPETAAEPAVSGEPEGSGAAADAGGAPAAPQSPAPEPPQASAETAPPPSAAPPEESAKGASPSEAAREIPQKRGAVPGKAAPKSRASLAIPDVRGEGPSAAKPEIPAWAAGKEVLVYRVEFLGLTMGYARFTFRGKVSVLGKEAYHVNVRAWTTDFLSVIYPINDSIDYYLDVKSLAPLRLEFARPVQEKDDVAIYDQENGKIVYRYKRTGEIRKQVDVPPGTYDPVSVAYYFRARDLGTEENPRHVYGGRKVWEISSRLLGRERIAVSGKPFDTVVIQPIMRREGKLSDRGDLKMWLTNDARHVPVRIFAKFKKIREWTLYAELMPPQEGG